MPSVGILALQGAFAEHEASFQKLPADLVENITFTQVRTTAELDATDALVIPGGESTTMKIIAGMDIFMDCLKAYVHGGKGFDGVERPPRPVWGTCAGCILFSDDVTNGAGGGGGLAWKPGQEPEAKRCKYGEQIGGIAISTCRNYFGRQVQSFEAKLTTDVCTDDESSKNAFNNFPAVFIRAPAIVKVGEGVRVLGRVQHPAATDKEGAIVAAASDQVLVTCFHPELADDHRIHEFFIREFVKDYVPNFDASQ